MKLKIFILFILSVNNAFGQKKEFRDTKVDSLTFLNNRKLLNSLNTDKFQKKLFVKNDIQIPYRFLTPKNNTKSKKFPLVITFHNSTRIGNDNENQLEPFAKIWLRDESMKNTHVMLSLRNLINAPRIMNPIVKVYKFQNHPTRLLLY
jgi:hypothetical protein